MSWWSSARTLGASHSVQSKTPLLVSLFSPKYGGITVIEKLPECYLSPSLTAHLALHSPARSTALGLYCILPDHKMCIKKKTVPIHMDPGVCTSRHSTRSHTACTQRHTGCTHAHTQPSNAGSPRTREKDDPKMYARTCHSMLTLMPASTLVYMGEQSVFTMTCSYCAQILKVGRP